MLDGKHRNIGATVGMIKNIHKIGDKGELAEELTLLFMEEAKDCNSKHETGACVFNGSIEPNLRCQVGNCPLGAIVDGEIIADPLDFGGNPDRMMLYGQNTMNYGGHIHIGYTGWRKWWNKLKKIVGKWMPYMLISAILAGAVWAISATAGLFSIHLF